MTPLDFASSETLRGPVRTAGGTSLLQQFRQLRAATMKLVEPLSAEDMTPQSMPDASPAKWHLAHTTWFFETFLLIPSGERPFDPAYQFLFNSYYEALGERQPRSHRGLITRPSVAEVFAYRAHVDAAMERLLAKAAPAGEIADLVSLGFAHEEQHQELLVTDILHLFAQNCLRPAYRAPLTRTPATLTPLSFTAFGGGIVEIGHDGEGFGFDNEGPRHQVLLRPFALADRMATNREWLAFMEDGGYRRPELWLSDGWAQVQSERWACPLYWRQADSGWTAFGLGGEEPLELDAPVVHISFYEADAFARWSGARLPLEAEWEHASHRAGVHGACVEDGLQARPSSGGALSQMFGDGWEWTASPYISYPGFSPASGAVGEYNGKFMINQLVLKGGSCATPQRHMRPSYRNFFQPHQRWQFAGLRLARS